MSKNLDLYIDQGADFVAVLPPVTDASGTVVDLSLYTAESQIRRSYASKQAIQLVANVTDAGAGVITLSLDHGQTAGLNPLRYVYDVIITAQDATRIKVYDGLMIVNPGVTDKPNTTLLTPYVPDDYGGIA